MASTIVQVAPFDLVVFGGTGDLAFRKLYPALYHRWRDGQFDAEARIYGVSRQKVDTAAFRQQVSEALKKFAPEFNAEDARDQAFIATLDYVTLDALSEQGWGDLTARLNEHPDKIRAYYLATSPELFSAIANGLQRSGLVTDKARLIVEKPIGKDLNSASTINAALGAVFDERQIFRIDHYLGKETVQNLMVLRFANALFEPLWNAAHIEQVQITVAETVGVGTRGPYYDTSGALRDMVQNHLLQLLCLTAMEPPAMLAADAIRDEKLKILRSLVPISLANVGEETARGQYRAGISDGGAVPGYAEELGKASNTETFVALRVFVGNWRWANVPFYLRTGKRLPRRESEIVVTFRRVPHSIFPARIGGLEPTELVIRLQPDEGIKLWLTIKEPGPGGLRVQRVPLDMSFAQAFGAASPEAYERLLMDVIRGDQTLFMRRDEVEAAWRFIDPILDAWKERGEAPKPYTAGTWGPSAAIALVERNGHTWYEEHD